MLHWSDTRGSDQEKGVRFTSLHQPPVANHRHGNCCGWLTNADWPWLLSITPITSAWQRMTCAWPAWWYYEWGPILHQPRVGQSAVWQSVDLVGTGRLDAEWPNSQKLAEDKQTDNIFFIVVQNKIVCLSFKDNFFYFHLLNCSYINKG